MIGYFTYSGMDLDNDGGRLVLGFTWIATTTTGVSGIVDWWADATAAATLIDLIFNLIK